MSDPSKSPNVQSLKNREYYRAQTLASPRRRRIELVSIDVNGESIEYEVRAPTLAAKQKITKACSDVDFSGDKPKVEIDQLKMAALSAVACVCIPGTDVKVFEDADLARLRESEVGGWEEQLMDAAVKMLRGPAPEEAKANLPSAPSDSASGK